MRVVVAEGVETPEQLQFLQEHSCPFAQGYYFSPPVVAKEFTQLLRISAGSVTETQPSDGVSVRRDRLPSVQVA
jgi:sensor c-di-GMP phosphodiesterase-like protein